MFTSLTDYMSKVKILFSIPNFDSAGSGKVVYDLIKGLDRSKFNPEILVRRTQGELFKRVQQLDVPIHVYDYIVPYQPFLSYPFRLIQLVRYLKSLNVDMIHAWNYTSDLSEPIAARLAGIKFIFTKKNMAWGNKAWLWKSKLSHHVIALNSQMMHDFFNPHTNIKAAYLPLGVDKEHFTPKPFDTHLAQQLGVQHDDFVIITVANIVPLKGIETLIRAFLEVDKGKLIIVGDHRFKHGTYLVNTYRSDKIIFTGKQLDVRSFLSLADVFCIPTEAIGEGMPMAPVEAMSMGLPVIGSRVPGIIDVLKGFEDLLFDPKNINQLADQIKKLMSMSDIERQRIGQAMREKVIAQYSYQDFIQSREAVYRSLV